MNIKNKVDEHKLLNDPDYRGEWIKDELKSSTDYFLNTIGTNKDYCVCDCERNYGKRCLDAESYLNGGCVD